MFLDDNGLACCCRRSSVSEDGADVNDAGCCSRLLAIVFNGEEQAERVSLAEIQRKDKEFNLMRFGLKFAKSQNLYHQIKGGINQILIFTFLFFF